jgi:hypothetical protein
MKSILVVFWSVLVAVVTATSAQGQQATSARPAADVTADVGSVTEITCRFVSGSGRPVVNELVNLLRNNVYIGTLRTDGNGFATFYADTLYGPVGYNFILRASNRWRTSSGKVTVTGVLPVVMSASIRRVGPTLNGRFTAQVTINYSGARGPGVTAAAPLANQLVRVKIRHSQLTGVWAPQDAQRTDATGKVQFNLVLPESIMRPGTVTIEGALPSAGDRHPGWFKDSAPYPSPFVRQVSISLN